MVSYAATAEAAPQENQTAIMGLLVVMAGLPLLRWVVNVQQQQHCPKGMAASAHGVQPKNQNHDACQRYAVLYLPPCHTPPPCLRWAASTPAAYALAADSR